MYPKTCQSILPEQSQCPNAACPRLGVSLLGKSAYLERLVLLPLSGDLLRGDLLPLRLLLPLCAGDLLLPGEALEL